MIKAIKNAATVIAYMIYSLGCLIFICMDQTVELLVWSILFVLMIVIIEITVKE